MKKTILLTAICVLVLSACTPQPTQLPAELPIIGATADLQPTGMPTLAPTPETSTTPPTASTSTLVPAPTSEPIKITLVNTSAVYKTSTRFVLDFSTSSGTYYAVARYPGGGPVKFTCKFDPEYKNHLVCLGGTAPSLTM